MAIPYFQAVGTFSGGTTSPRTPSYPAGVQAGDVAICYAISENNAVISFPADWTKVEQRNQGTGATAAWAWRRLAGDELGTINVTRSTGTVMFFAGIAIFRGCITAETSIFPFESNASNSATSNAPASSLITTTGPDRLAVCLICIEDNIAPSALTGWLEKWDQATSQGNDGELAGDTKDVPMQGDVPAATCTLASSENWVTFTFALIPLPAGAHYYLTGAATAAGIASAARNLSLGRVGTAVVAGVPTGLRAAAFHRTGAADATATAGGARLLSAARAGDAAATGIAAGSRRGKFLRVGAAVATGTANGLATLLGGVIKILGEAVATGIAGGTRTLRAKRLGSAIASAVANGIARLKGERYFPIIGGRHIVR